MSKSKWGKTILGLVAVGGAVVAGALYLSKKNKCEDCDDFDAEFEDEDFDLDGDLKPAADRGYVSLTPSAEADEEVAEKAEEEATEEAEEVIEEKTEE